MPSGHAIRQWLQIMVAPRHTVVLLQLAPSLLAYMLSCIGWLCRQRHYNYRCHFKQADEIRIQVTGCTSGFTCFLMMQASVREVKRLDSISRSPVYTSIGEAINGVATLRAFRYGVIQSEQALGVLDCVVQVAGPHSSAALSGSTSVWSWPRVCLAKVSCEPPWLWVWMQ